MITGMAADLMVASYVRNYNNYKRYMTLPEHMPDNHMAVYEWNPERFMSWAQKIGPHTCELIKSVLKIREYPVQTYRTCMGIMRFGSNYSGEIMEFASREAFENNTVSYKYFSIIVKSIAAKAAKAQTERVVVHENVRGRNAFAGGGINA